MIRANDTGIAAGATVTAGGETGTRIEKTIVAGSSITISASAAPEGYQFNGWYSGGQRLSAEREYTYIPQASGTILADYSQSGL